MAQDNEFNLMQAMNMSPDMFEKQQQLNRNQQFARMLMAPQATQQPQGQMVSGRYVPTSFFQNLAPVANMLTGAYMQNRGDEQAKALAQELRGTRTSEMDAINQAIMNKDFATAQKLINASTTGAGKEMLPRLMERNIPAVEKPQVVARGGVLVGPDGKEIYKNPYVGAGDGEDGMAGGRFNKKGDYIAPGGVFIGKTEVAKDREIARTANELRQGLQEISPKDVKDTESVFGSVVEGGPISYLAKQFKNPAVAAQAKINASSVMQTLQNLPPGPASDKDIAQARSSFPGYGNAEDLQTWITNTNAMLERKINNVNSKYGSEDWYGATGINTKDKPAGGARTVKRTGKVTSGPNAGKTATEYSDGTVEYK
jgi:hypothetical protein